MEHFGQPYCREGATAELVEDAILSRWRVCSQYIAEANRMKASCGVTLDIFVVVVCVPVQGDVRCHGKAAVWQEDWDLNGT